MKRTYIQPSIQVVMMSEATSVMYDTSVPFGGDLDDSDSLPPADAKKHGWGSDFELWDSYTNEQATSHDVWN